MVVQTEVREQAPPSTSDFAPAYRLTSAGILILVTLIAFEAMAVAAALPTAARELHGVGSIGWAFTAFLVANVVGLVISGQICDTRGPRLATAAGLVAFIGGLAISGTAATMAQLVAGRAVQGLGGGLLITAIYVLEYPNANGEKHEDWVPRVRKVGRDGKTTTLVTFPKKDR